MHVRLKSRLIWAVMFVAVSMPVLALHGSDLPAGATPVSQGGCAVPGNVVQNCGFETGVAAPWVETNKTTLDGVMSNNDLSSTDTGPYEYRFGETTAPGSSVSQTLAVTPNTAYLLQFEINTDSATGGQLTASVSGTSTGTQSLVEHGGGYPFNPESLQFTSGAGTSVTLTFTAYNVASIYGPPVFDIDDVMVTPKRATSTVANTTVSPPYGSPTKVNQGVVATTAMLQTPELRTYGWNGGVLPRYESRSGSRCPGHEPPSECDAHHRRTSRRRTHHGGLFR